jgi:hypothetical protein
VVFSPRGCVRGVHDKERPFSKKIFGFAERKRKEKRKKEQRVKG